MEIYFAKNKIYLQILYYVKQGDEAENLRNIFNLDKNNILSLFEQQKIINYLKSCSTAGIDFKLNNKTPKIKIGETKITNLDIPLPCDLQINLNYIFSINLHSKHKNVFKLYLNKNNALDKLPLHLQKGKNVRINCQKKFKKTLKKIKLEGEEIISYPTQIVCEYK